MVLGFMSVIIISTLLGTGPLSQIVKDLSLPAESYLEWLTK